MIHFVIEQDLCALEMILRRQIVQYHIWVRRPSGIGKYQNFIKRKTSFPIERLSRKELKKQSDNYQ